MILSLRSPIFIFLQSWLYFVVSDDKNLWLSFGVLSCLRNTRPSESKRHPHTGANSKSSTQMLRAGAHCNPIAHFTFTLKKPTANQGKPSLTSVSWSTLKQVLCSYTNCHYENSNVDEFLCIISTISKTSVQVHVKHNILLRKVLWVFSKLD